MSQVKKGEEASPSGFVEVTLGEVASEGVMQYGPLGGVDFTYIDIGSIDRERKIILSPKVMPTAEAPSRAKQNLQAGDVLVSLTRPNLNAVAMVSHEHDSAVGSTGFQVLRSKWVHSNFLYYLVQTDRFVDEMSALVQGALYPAIRPKDVSSFKFLLPSSLLQSRIVSKLEELLSDLDAGVSELKAAQAKLGQYRQSLLKAAVDGSLTAEWRKTHTPQESGAQLLERILNERRKRWEAKQLAKFQEQGKTPPKGWENAYPEPVKPDTKGLPKLPEGWVWASLDQVSEIQGGIQKQPSRAPVANKYPFLRVANVSRGILVLDEVHEIELFEGELSRFQLQVGDLLIVEGNGSLTEIGRCALWDGSVSNAVHQNHLIRARSFGVNAEFVEAWINSLYGISQLTHLAATTSGLYTLSVGKLSKIPVPIPAIDEQTAAIQLLCEVLGEYKRRESSIEEGLRQATAQRKNILKAAFSGQLMPQDPNDEPASVLLERIRAERAVQGAKAAKRGRKAKA